MEFIVEDGSGIANATSYGSVEEASLYFANLGNEDWDASDANATQAALNAASRQVDLLYASRFKGDKLTAEQALLFPRTEFSGGDGYARTGVPKELKEGVFETALLVQQGGGLVTNPDRDEQLKKSTYIVGDLEQTKEYFAGVSTSKSTAVELALRPILKAGTRGSIRVERA